MMGIYLADIILLVAGPIALDKIGWKFFFVLIIPTALHIVFVYFMCPETKGRSLEDINAQFGEKVAIHYYGATEQERAELEEEAMHIGGHQKTHEYEKKHISTDVQEKANAMHLQETEKSI